MKAIAAGRLPVDQSFYEIVEIAERYGVHPQTVYAGMRAGHPLYPVPMPPGDGPRPRRYVLMDEVEACDQRRIAFYRTTPSWFEPLAPDRPEKFTRRSARDLLGQRPPGNVGLKGSSHVSD